MTDRDSEPTPVHFVAPPITRDLTAVEIWSERLAAIIGVLGVAVGTVAGVVLAQGRLGPVGTILLCVAGAALVGLSFYYVGIIMSMTVSFLVIFKRPLLIFLGSVGVVALGASWCTTLFGA